MLQQIIIGFTFVGLAFIGAILAQTNNVNHQTNSNSANSLSNSNSGMPPTVLTSEKSNKVHRKIESCRFFSRSDAEKLQREPLESARDSTRDEETSCYYTTSGAFARSVGYSYRTYPTWQIAKKAYKLKLEIEDLAEIVYAANDGRKSQFVRGIGESAQASNSKDSQSIFVQKGRTNFTLTVDHKDKIAFQRLKQIARKIAAKF